MHVCVPAHVGAGESSFSLVMNSIFLLLLLLLHHI